MSPGFQQPLPQQGIPSGSGSIAPQQNVQTTTQPQPNQQLPQSPALNVPSSQVPSNVQTGAIPQQPHQQTLPLVQTPSTLQSNVPNIFPFNLFDNVENCMENILDGIFKTGMRIPIAINDFFQDIFRL